MTHDQYTVRREIPGGRWTCPTCGKSVLRGLMARHPDDCVSAQPVAEPVAWIDNSGHPKHLSHVQSVSEKRLYGPLRPLYEGAKS